MSDHDLNINVKTDLKVDEKAVEKKALGILRAFKKISKEGAKGGGEFDKSLKDIDKSLNDLEKMSRKAGERMQLSFSGASLLTSVLHGDLHGIGEQLLALISKVKILGSTIGKIPGIILTSGIAAILAQLKQYLDIIKDRIRDFAKQRIDGVAQSFDMAAKNADIFERTLNRANQRAKEGLEIAKARRTAEAEITKANIERERKTALAGAFTERETYEVNKRFDTEQRNAERKERRDSLATDEKAARLDAAKLEKQLAKERATLAKQQNIQRQLGKMQSGAMDDFTKDTYINRVKEEYGFSNFSADDLANMSDLDKRFSEAIRERNEKIKDLESQRDIIQESLKNFAVRAKQIDAEELAQDAEVSLRDEMERRNRKRAEIEKANREEDNRFDEEEERREHTRRESERGAGYKTLLQNAAEILKQREAEYNAARGNYFSFLREVENKTDNELSEEQRQRRDRLYSKYRQAQSRKRSAETAKADLEYNQIGVSMRDANEQADRAEAVRNARREEQRQRISTVMGGAADRGLAAENVRFHESTLAERRAEFSALGAELAGKYGKGFSISDLGSLDRERFNRARGRVWESEDNLRAARFEKDRADYTHMIEADKNFRDISTKSNRLTAMGLAGGGFSWGESMSKDTRKLVTLTERMLYALSNPKTGTAAGVAWSMR